MTTLTDEQCLEAFRAFQKTGDQGRAGNCFDPPLSRKAIKNRLDTGVRRKLFDISETITRHPKANNLRIRQREAAAEIPPADPVELRRLREALNQARKERDEAIRRALAAEDMRSGVLGLPPMKMASMAAPVAPSGKASKSVIFHLSDIQYGETIALPEMDGINCFNLEIANKRLARAFDTVARLMTEFWDGKPPQALHLCLGGDLVSGSIHAELARTDGLMRLPSAQAVARQIAIGIRHIRKAVGCKIIVYTVPGNHGRLTVKPESKGAALDSLDTLAAMFIEAALKDDDGIEVLYTPSIDVVFRVYGYPFVLTHGDRMGSRGGQGFQGPVATIIRGHLKVHKDYSDRGIIPYKILSGHFHTSFRWIRGYGNGSVAGWSDYARDLRADKEPAQQTYLVVHAERGVIEERQIQLGAPDEGSIYRGYA